jgi:serine/threonine protein kinase, bacterial
MYVVHTGADRVDVLDCAAGTWLRALPDHPGVAGVRIDADADLLFTSDRAAGQVSVYRCSGGTLLARVGVGAHPNGLAFDPGRGRLFSFNLGEPVGKNCTASVIDLDQHQVIRTIPLPGRPRWAAYDRATDHVYVNIRDPAEILAISSATLAIDRLVAVPTELDAHTLGIDPQRRAVYVFLPASGGAAIYEDR